MYLNILKMVKSSIRLHLSQQWKQKDNSQIQSKKWIMKVLQELLLVADKKFITPKSTSIEVWVKKLMFR